MRNEPQVSNINFQDSLVVLTCFRGLLGAAFHTNLYLPGWLAHCIEVIPSLGGTTLLSVAVSAKQGFMDDMKEPCESKKRQLCPVPLARLLIERCFVARKRERDIWRMRMNFLKHYLEWLYACVCKFTPSGLRQLPGRRLANLQVKLLHIYKTG